jgi:hypothetical protein
MQARPRKADAVTDSKHLRTVAWLAIAVIVPWAEYSPTVNSLVKQLLHIDIRSEIAYLLHMTRQNHY